MPHEKPGGPVMTKVVLITTKKPPDWESWKDLKSRKKREGRITMTQGDALAIFQKVIAATTAEEASAMLLSEIPNRRRLTSWLGQIGQKDMRLGKNRDFNAYITAVVVSIRNRNRDHELPSDRKEEQEMGKKDQRPVVIVRKNKRQNGIEESPETTERTAASGEDGNTNPVSNDEMTLALNGPEKVQESEGKGESSSDTPPEDKPATTVSKVQEYALKTLLTYADCAVQKDEEGIFHVLGRNFEDKPMLHFWLWKVGYGHLSRFIRNKDLLDSLRILSREIYRDMKETVGKPIPRW